MKFKSTLLAALIAFSFGQCKKTETTSTEVDSVTTGSDSISTSGFKLSDYEAYLKSLPIEMESSKTALIYFRDHADTTNKTVNDLAFDAFIFFQDSVIRKLNSDLPNRPDYAEVESMSYGDTTAVGVKAKAYEKALEASGFVLKGGEGGAYIESDPRMMREYFYRALSIPMKKYFNEFETETINGFADDAGITIAIRDVADRIGFWDTFLADYPKHKYAERAEGEVKSYLYFFLIGMDNTPAFGYDESGELAPEFRDAYDYYLKTYPTTRSAAVIKEYLALLKKNDDKKTPEVEAFIAKHDIY